MYRKNLPRNISHFFILICFLFIITPFAYGGTTGKIAGNITSSSGEILPGANIFIESKIIDGNEVELSSPLGAASDLNGDYFVLNIPPGNYVIQCYLIGYKKVIQKPVYISVDRTTTLNFTLEEEVLEGEEIVVIAERPLITKDLTATTAKVSGEVIQDLPVESFTEVLALQAGVTEGISGGLHIRGGGDHPK